METNSSTANKIEDEVDNLSSNFLKQDKDDLINKDGLTSLKNIPTTKLKSRPSFKKDRIDAHYDAHPLWVVAAFGRLFGLEFAPIKIPITRRLQTFAVFFWMSTFLFMGFGAFVFLTYLFLYTRFWWISFGYLTYFIGDRTIASRGGKRINWVRNWQLWKHQANFFPAAIVKTCDYDPTKNYIFGYHPHGILSAGAFIHFGTEGSGFSKLFPYLTPHLVVLESHFNMPIYRDFFLCSGAIGSSKESLSYVLSKEEGGRVLGLVVGGAKESLDCHPGKVTLSLTRRKGFIKIAIRKGASLVPTFSFGENEIYEQVSNPVGSTIRGVQEWIRGVIGLAPCLFLGRGIFQYSFGIVPFRKPINTVFGPPIHTEKTKDPTQEQIDAVHKKYVTTLKNLYDEYKAQYAEDPTAEMKII